MGRIKDNFIKCTQCETLFAVEKGNENLTTDDINHNILYICPKCNAAIRTCEGCGRYFAFFTWDIDFFHCDKCHDKDAKELRKDKYQTALSTLKSCEKLKGRNVFVFYPAHSFFNSDLCIVTPEIFLPSTLGGKTPIQNHHYYYCRGLRAIKAAIREHIESLFEPYDDLRNSAKVHCFVCERCSLDRTLSSFYEDEEY